MQMYSLDADSVAAYHLDSMSEEGFVSLKTL
jgi:hypothetical protein